MKFLHLSTLAGDPLPLTLGAKVVKPVAAKPDLQPVPGKPHLFVNQQGRLSYAPPAPPDIPATRTQAQKVEKIAKAYGASDAVTVQILGTGGAGGSSTFKPGQEVSHADAAALKRSGVVVQWLNTQTNGWCASDHSINNDLRYRVHPDWSFPKATPPVDEWLDTRPSKPGWVCASKHKDKSAFRYWDGNRYSLDTLRDANPSERGRAMAEVAPHQHLIKWNPSVTVPWED